MGSLVTMIEKEARVQKFSKVLKLQLGVGDLSGVNIQAIEFCFAELTRHTVLENCDLQMQRVPVELACGDCLIRSECQDITSLRCKRCDSNNVEILCGKDFSVIHLEVI